MTTYAIYEENMERLEKKLARIAGKCEKYGCDFHYEQVGEEYREIENEDGEKVTARFILVEAEGTAVKSGWEFIATLEHTEKGNIINGYTDIEVPERYYTAEAVCEHCNCKRRRTYTYIVRNTETGEFKQVGRSCLNDFTNGLSAEAITKYISLFDSLIEGEATQPGCRIKPYYNVQEYLHYAAETIRHYGYIKRDSERNQKCTADHALEFMLTDHHRIDRYVAEAREEEMERIGFNPESEQAEELVQASLEWLEGQPEDSNYMHNLKTAAGLEYTERRNIGILASLFPTYNRELERAAELKKKEEAAARSNYIGEIKERITVAVEDVTCLTWWNGMYGTVWMYKIVDSEGNTLIWKTSSYIEDKELVEEITGTVKEHSEFRGEKQTVLTRCKCKRREPQEWAFDTSVMELI